MGGAAADSPTSRTRHRSSAAAPFSPLARHDPTIGGERRRHLILRRSKQVTHMDRYLEELEFRFNNRANPYILRDTLARIMRTDPLEYRRLIASNGNWKGDEQGRDPPERQRCLSLEGTFLDGAQDPPVGERAAGVAGPT